MSFHELALSLEELETTASRLEITAVLADVFKKASTEEIDKIAYLTLGRLAPKFAGQEFQLSSKSMIKIIARAYGREEADVTKLFKQEGDMGLVAWQLAKEQGTINKEQTSSKSQVTNSKQSVSEIFNSLMAIAQEEGSGSVERKIAQFSDLLQTLDPLSAKYAVRIPIGALRLGFSDMTILDALSWMETGDKRLRKPLENYFNVSSDIGLVAREFTSKGERVLMYPKIRPGIPIRPQQAERLKTAEEMIEKVGTAAVEWKLDGFRAQIHVFKSQEQENMKTQEQQQLLLGAQNISDKMVMIFSRSMDQTTAMFPEIVNEAARLDVESIVLDGEAIGYDPATGKHLPFQETIQRKRKHGIHEIMGKIPLRYYAFDILSLDGTDYLDKPFKERRLVLEWLFEKNRKNVNLQTFTIADHMTTNRPEELKVQFQESVARGYEGIMVKKQDALYQAGARNFNWIKFKHLGEGKLADTLDCVVMGTYRGQGKRSGFGIGAFLVGVRDRHPEGVKETEGSKKKDSSRVRLDLNDTFKTVAKIGTGLSDEQWKELNSKCQTAKVELKPIEYIAPKDLTPDTWVTPTIVVEIAADEITKSPMHTAGLALRFPRLMRFRNDKQLEEASTTQELKKLFEMQ